MTITQASISKWLKEGMDKRGVTQTAMAAFLTKELGRNIDKAAVNKMASGKRRISADEFIAAMELTGFAYFRDED